MSTKGMHAVGQAEVVILLQCLPDEKTVPKDVFTHFVQLYQEALSGRKAAKSWTRLCRAFRVELMLFIQKTPPKLYLSVK